MNALQEWAQRWDIPALALTDLLQSLGALAPLSQAEPPDPKRTSEAYVQSLVRLEAPNYGVWLTRNNVGAKVMIDEKTGNKSFVRWGLANESSAQNEKLKSGDLIGMRKKLIEPKHVGTFIGQIVSRECKHVGWSFNNKDEHEIAQLNWALLVNSYGGDAGFATGEGTFT
jgi:hypothetical protein